MREIIQYPDIRLKQTSSPVEKITSDIIDVATDMKYYVNKSGIAGIAAPQLGSMIRMIAVVYGNEIKLIINPEIVKKSEKMMPSEEGCLSIRNGKQKFIIKRHKQVKVKGFDMTMNPVTYKGRDIFGVALQHEIDHLDGRVLLDLIN